MHVCTCECDGCTIADSQVQVSSTVLGLRGGYRNES